MSTAVNKPIMFAGRKFVSEIIPAGGRVEFDASDVAEGEELAIEPKAPCVLLVDGSEQLLAANVVHRRGLRKKFAIECRVPQGTSLEIRVGPPPAAEQPAETATPKAAAADDSARKRKGKRA